jgi:GNAT superfamily N-acetyltransferase
MTLFTISDAGSGDVADIAALFRAYAATLPVDLAPQGFEQELKKLPGAYARPSGALLIARAGDGAPLGCTALRRIDDEICEVKRLYVAPEARGAGLGRALVAAATERANRAGYREIKLDTLPGMHAAIALYEKSGFAPIAPYGSHPYPGLICLGKVLR